MASWTSRELVRRLHAALDRRTRRRAHAVEACSTSIASCARTWQNTTRSLRAATVALCVATGQLLSRWLIAWVGDCRIYRVRNRRQDEPRIF
jgi:serine/threonine protein phosphatase PrpC